MVGSLTQPHFHSQVGTESKGYPGLSSICHAHGEIKTPFELIERLAKSEHVEQVFVRHVFRFFMGRNETLGDAKTLQGAHKAYVDSDGSMKALVASLLSSDSFVFRVKHPQPDESP